MLVSLNSIATWRWRREGVALCWCQWGI